MSHLVGAVLAADGVGLELARCYDLVREAHDYLAQRGREAVARAGQQQDLSSWGGTVKRVRVTLPINERPALIAPAEPYHNLIEVINQCASMERLLDALTWAQTAESGLANYTVVSCHPTTSSAQAAGKKALDDHDLVLAGPSGDLAKFEVSDVASEADGNRKEEKDLISLGVRRKGAGEIGQPAGWPSGRLFLVVSEEFGRRLSRTKHGWSAGYPPAHQYTQVKASGPTRIFEITPRWPA